MALSDDDKNEISAMIAEASAQSRPPAPRRSSGTTRAEPAMEQSEWERMSDRQRQSYVREMVEDHLATLDAEAERAELRRENEELRKQVSEWEKGGRRGPKPKVAAGDDKRTEEAPTIVTKAYRWLFGDMTAPTQR